MYKAIFIDIDGTLVDDEKRIAPETARVLEKLKKMGVTVVLTSGKPSLSVQSFAEKCFATPYSISAAGALVKDFEKNENLFSWALPREVALKVLKKIKEKKLYTMVIVGENLVVDELKFGMEPKNRPEAIAVDDLVKYFEETKEPILKLVIIDHDRKKLDRFYDELKEIEGIYLTATDRIKIPKRFRGAGEDYKDPYEMDVTAQGVHKAKAIKCLIDHLGIDISETVAMGDGTNDIEMFEAVNYKIAMENGVEEVKKMADLVTCSNNEAGVAEGLCTLYKLNLDDLGNDG